MTQASPRNRQQLTSLFTDPAVLWFVHGVYVRQGTSEIKLTYWQTGKVRGLLSLVKGLKDGVAINFAPSGDISSYRHYRNDKPWGEAAVYDPQGGVKKHVLADGVSEVDYSEEAAGKYGGYLMDDAKEALGKKYEPFGCGRWLQ
jgi:hypothetical protein